MVGRNGFEQKVDQPQRHAMPAMRYRDSRFRDFIT